MQMKNLLMLRLILLYLLTLSISTLALGQEQENKARLAIGISAPEMLHFGLGIDISKSNQLGFYGGIGPSWGTIWTSLNVEHRWYFGNLSDATNRKKWFFKQGYSYYPKGDDSIITLTIGKDLKSKNINNGWTIDWGLLYLIGHQRGAGEPPAIFPALRFQYYGFIKSKSK